MGEVNVAVEAPKTFIERLKEIRETVRDAKEVVGNLMDAAEVQVRNAAQAAGNAVEGLGATKKEIVRELLEVAFGDARVAVAWPLISVLIDTIAYLRKRAKGKPA